MIQTGEIVMDLISCVSSIFVSAVDEYNSFLVIEIVKGINKTYLPDITKFIKVIFPLII